MKKEERLNIIIRLNKMRELVEKKIEIQDCKNSRKLLKLINDLIEEQESLS